MQHWENEMEKIILGMYSPETKPEAQPYFERVILEAADENDKFTKANTKTLNRKEEDQEKQHFFEENRTDHEAEIPDDLDGDMDAIDKLMAECGINLGE